MLLYRGDDRGSKEAVSLGFSPRVPIQKKNAADLFAEVVKIVTRDTGSEPNKPEVITGYFQGTTRVIGCAAARIFAGASYGSVVHEFSLSNLYFRALTAKGIGKELLSYEHTSNISQPYVILNQQDPKNSTLLAIGHATKATLEVTFITKIEGSWFTRWAPKGEPAKLSSKYLEGTAKAIPRNPNPGKLKIPAVFGAPVGKKL